MAKFKDKERFQRGNKSKKWDKKDPKKDSKSHEPTEKLDDDKLEGSKFGKVNDISWYQKNPDLLRAAGNLSFANALGSGINLSNANCKLGLAADEQRIPGIATIHTITGPGLSRSANSGVNIAMRNLYSFVRHANSGHSNYDPVDLMLYLLAMDEAYMAYFRAVRAYGAMFTFNTLNRYAPKALVEALGFDYEDINKNLATFRYAINAYAARINAYAVPTNMPLFKRHAWLFSSIYTDENVSKAQIYAFTTDHYRIYDEKYSKGGRLVAKAWKPKLKVEDWISVANEIADPITTSEDLGIISGDLIKAFGRENLHTLATLADNYVVLPTYVPEVMDQIHNLQAVGDVELASNNIEQDPTIGKGNLIYDPIIKSGKNPVLYGDRIIDFKVETPTPEDVIVASRLAVSLEPSPDGTKAHFVAMGTEFVTHVGIHTLYHTASGNVKCLEQTFDTIAAVEGGFADAASVSLFLSGYTKASKFVHFPIQYACMGNASDPNGQSIRIFGELGTYSTINSTTLNKLHDVCVLSLLDVPIKL